MENSSPPEGVERDAIHIAVAPVVAGEHLLPGDHVGLWIAAEGVVGKECDAPLGIVDPFLPPEGVKKGERFYLFLYPNTITSLRHEWVHPAFSPPKEKKKSSLETSELWLRRFCETHDCPPWPTVLAALKGELEPPYPGFVDDYGPMVSFIDEEIFHFNGRDAHDEIPEEFWTHVENLLGPQKFKPKAFSCSC